MAVNSTEGGTYDVSTCVNIFSNLLDITDQEKLLHLTFKTAISVLNILFNMLVIVSIYKTKQQNIRSIKLTLYLSISSCDEMIIGQSLYMLVVFNNIIDCAEKFISAFLISVFKYTSFTIVCLIVFDRYLRIRHPNRYELIFEKKPFLISLVITISIDILQAFLFCISHMYFQVVYLTYPINVISIITVLGLHKKSVTLLKQHKLRTQRFSTVSIDVSIFAKRYLYSLLSYCVFGLD